MNKEESNLFIEIDKTINGKINTLKGITPYIKIIELLITSNNKDRKSLLEVLFSLVNISGNNNTSTENNKFKEIENVIKDKKIEKTKKIENIEDILFEVTGDQNDIDWDILLHMIFQQILILKPDRAKLSVNQSRIDLDPIIITPVESLNHAYYHLAYHRDFTTSAEIDRIPFLNENEIGYPTDVFNNWFVNQEKTTTAVASRNTNDLTLRLSPIPQQNRKEFFIITLQSYKRNCYKECSKNGLVDFGKENIFNIKEICDISDVCANNNKTKSVENNNETENVENKERNKDIKKCKGTARGLLYAMTKAINKVDTDKVFMLRVYNKKNYNMSRDEMGSITFLVRYEGNFTITKFKSKLTEELKCIMENIGVSKHVHRGDILIEKLTAGRVFVSIPFNNPMSKTWINIIKEEAINVGLESVVAETYTKSATVNIKTILKESDAMIQIFTKELPDKNKDGSTYEASWLHTEYFGFFEEKPIVRLIDKKTVHPSELVIGRDHPSIHFSIASPESEFRKLVSEALTIIRKELADVKGFS